MAEKLINIMTTQDALQAEFLRGFLDSHGLHASLSTDRPGWTGRYSAMSRGIRLAVPEHEVKQAKALIEEVESGAHSFSEEELAQLAQEEAHEETLRYCEPKVCPGCGSANILKNTGRGILYWVVNLLFLGIPWLFTTDTWVCADCGWEWTRESAAGEQESDPDGEQ